MFLIIIWVSIVTWIVLDSSVIGRDVTDTYMYGYMSRIKQLNVLRQQFIAQETHVFYRIVWGQAAS